MASEEAGGIEAEVIPKPFLGECECKFCHDKITTQYMRVFKFLRGGYRAKEPVIAVDCYEFDEGTQVRYIVPKCFRTVKQ